MSQLTHVFVTVPEGREVPVPANESSAAGGALQRCRPGNVYKLPWTTFTRRRIAGGDFTLSNMRGTKVTTPNDARADASVKVDHDGVVAKDQRTDDQINEAAAKLAASTAITEAAPAPAKLETDTKGKA